MSIKTEPYVKVREIIKKTPAVVEADNNSDIGLVIISDYGEKLGRVTGPSDFLSKYTLDGVTIPRDADITFINAYYMSYFASLVISRSINTTATKGLMFYTIDQGGSRYIDTNDVWYKDGTFLDLNSIWSFTIRPTYDSGRFAMILNGTVYYSNTTKEDLLMMYPEYDNYQSFVALSDFLYDVSGSVTGEEVVESLSEFKSSLYANLGLIDEVYPQSIGFTYYDSNSSQIQPSDIIAGTSVDHIEVLISFYHTNGQMVIPGLIQNPCGSMPYNTGIQLNECGPNSTDPSNCDTNGNIIISPSQVVPLGIEIFGVYANTNAVTDYLKMTLEANQNEDKFGIVFNDEIYQVSLDPDAVDSNEVSIYIDYMNTLGLPFTIDVRYNDSTKYQVEPYELGAYNVGANSLFGSGVDSSEMGRTPYMIKAADELADQDLYDLAYLSCAGCTKLSFVKRMSYISENHNWFLPIDVPKEYITVGMIKKYFTDLGIDSSYVEAMGPFDKNQSLTGWINYIAASSLWYERLMRNKSNDEEFAPIYKETYGILTYTDPVKILLKSQREELLNLGRPVNYINYNNRTKNYYLNDNWTHQSADDVMSEDNNRRLNNKIKRDIDHNMDQFISRQNNAETRSQVVDMVNYYFSNEIMNKPFAPEAYEVICNSKNNTEAVIRARQLKLKVRVRFYNTIKYIDVIDEVYAIGVEFEK